MSDSLPIDQNIATFKYAVDAPPLAPREKTYVDAILKSTKNADNGLTSIMVLAKIGATTAQLMTVTDGKTHRDTLSRRNLVRLITSAAEALGRMDGDGV